MPERWRRPAEILSIEHDHEEGIWLPDGRVQGVVRITVSKDTLERMRTGYMCAKCMEPFEVAWPERCDTCGAPIRTAQAEYFAKEFGGVQQLGGSKLEIDGIHERAEKERRNGS